MALTVSVVTSVLVERVAVASVCVRDVLVPTASVDPTANVPRKASIAASQSELNYNRTITLEYSDHYLEYSLLYFTRSNFQSS